jgi:hypothetical protein
VNTVQHTTTTVTRHQVRMKNTSSEGLNRRDLGDFLHQADLAFEKAKGRIVMADDDYYVRGDEGGITAYFETENAAPSGRATALKHFAPYGAFLAADNTPIDAPWDLTTGDWSATSAFTVHRALTTCPDCRSRFTDDKD